MKKPLTTSGCAQLSMLILMATCGLPAMADWELMVDSAEAKFMVDKSTLEIEGKTRRVWQLQELKALNDAGILSTRTRVEYDCGGKRVRILELYGHDQAMAAGDVIARVTTPQPWSKIKAKSAFGTISTVLCKLK